jgi:hypothetical protein
VLVCHGMGWGGARGSFWPGLCGLQAKKWCCAQSGRSLEMGHGVFRDILELKSSVSGILHEDSKGGHEAWSS